MVPLHDGLDKPDNNGISQLLQSWRTDTMVRERNGDVWLTPKEAADMLGLSVGRVYHIKNFLTHRKGNTRASRIYFLESTLIDDYLNI